MATNRNPAVNALDFDQVKQNFIDYLKGQEQFLDYNFEGSGISTLLDILAYSIHYNGFYANMALNETFLDSAIQRTSVISRAKELGYLPRSVTAPAARVQATFTVPGSPSTFVLPRGSRFTTVLDGTTYTFTNTEGITFNRNINNFYTGQFDLYQGVFATFTYTADTGDETQRFIVPNRNIDSRFISVKIKENVWAREERIYRRIDSIVNENPGPEDEVFFVEKSYDDLYEITFGDGVFGKELATGNFITIEYLLSQGDATNGASVFSTATGFTGATNVLVQTVRPAFGGAPEENIASIKRIAPRFYQAQERGMTNEDIVPLVLRDYPNFVDVVAWGGEENPMPKYGVVFVAARPRDGIYVSEAEKIAIGERLTREYAVMSQRFEIVNPDFIFVDVRSRVKYDGTNSNLTSGDITTFAKEAIQEYFTRINTFQSDLVFSKMSAAIDNKSQYILGNITSFILRKIFSPSKGINNNYTLYFSNSLQPRTMVTTSYTAGTRSGVFMKDIPNDDKTTGKIVAYYINNTNGSEIIINANVGIVNYATGLVQLNSFSPTDYEGNSIQVSFDQLRTEDDVFVDDFSFDVFTNKREQIISLGTITVTTSTNTSGL